MYRRSIISFVLGACYVLSSIAWAQDPQEHRQSGTLVFPAMGGPITTHPWVKRVNESLHEILEQPVKLDYFEMSLADVTEDLKTRFKIRIILHESAVVNGLNQESMLTIQVDGRPLRIALEQMLASFNCTYQPSDDVVYFIDKETAYSYLGIRMYDCRDLLKSDGQGQQSAVKLMRLITSSVEPYSWDTNGGKGSISEFGGVLVVFQRPLHQISVQELLGALRKRLANNSNSPQNTGETKVERTGSVFNTLGSFVETAGCPGQRE